MRRRQQGVALITIMLIVVVATVLSVQMASEQNIAVNRTASLFSNYHAEQYAYGGEELARQILHASFKEHPAVDALTDTWASPNLSYAFDNGEVKLTIEDLQSRLNVNTEANSLERSRLYSLASAIGVDGMFIDRIVDWVDADGSKTNIGAEDYDYLGLERPYRTAGSPMVDESELRLLFEMTDEAYGKLARYVAPVPEVVKVNVNTASALVIKSLSNNITMEMAEGIVAQRESNGKFANLQAFLDALPQGTDLNPDGLGVQSSFFRVSVLARYYDRYAYLTSVIQRDPSDGSMRVIYRDLGKKIAAAVVEVAAPEVDNG